MKFENENSNIIYCKNTFYKKFNNNTFYSNNGKYYYRGYEVHRVDGPAIEWCDDTKMYYLDGKYYTKEKYLKLKNLKIKNRVLNEI